MEQERTAVTRLMTPEVLTVTTDASVEEAAKTLLAEDIGSLVVVDETGRPVGMFTTTDLAEFVSDSGTPGDTTVSQYMTNRVVSIGTHDSIRDAAAKMIRHGIHHLPVTDEQGSVAGMLSTMDLTSHFSYTGGTDMI
ncbi:CBS domain-containing protein [Haloferax namakaokahaiae]|uniref:CBS domain-containing protein n=1 Tax=Haloferax namakaokahaiae TaxID=1748331 RepID=A0ABD5ZCN6_9EURY